MSAFIVFFHLPALLTKEFISLVPPHRTLINQLLAEHALETYAISADRGRGWITLRANDEAEVLALLARFPLYKYFNQIAIDKLFVFDSATAQLPTISLN